MLQTLGRSWPTASALAALVLLGCSSDDIAERSSDGSSGGERAAPGGGGASSSAGANGGGPNGSGGSGGSAAPAHLIFHESFENQRGTDLNDVGFHPSLRPRNNACSSIDSGTCGNTCGNDNEGRCCRTGHPDAETFGSVIDDWAVARFNGGQQWSLNGTTHTVPQPVDGQWVYRAYAPDCSMQSPYRCNDFTKPVRLRALIASTSGDDINSRSEDRWYGLATWIDPAWDFEGWAKYVDQTMMSQHLPNGYGSGGGPLRIGFFKGNDGIHWHVKAALEATTYQGAVDAGCQNVATWGDHFGCTDREMDILNPDGSPSGARRFDFDRTDDVGHWMYWVVHLRHDPTGTGGGVMEIWLKRHDQPSYWKIVDYTGYVGVMAPEAPYFKFGISDKDPDGACPEIIYYDNFRVGDGQSGFADVDPS